MMSDHGQLLLDWSFQLLSNLNKLGVTDAFISPGSRSTPLVLAAHQIKSLKKRVVVDERSAAFQALGLAKAQARPVIIICTSGTAATNFFPAIVEAHLSRIPLIAITADRPPKFREIGAQQTIDQVKLYGNHAHFFDLGEASESDFNRIPVLAAQVMHEASKGEVIHINSPFRKPLEPQIWKDEQSDFTPDTFDFSFIKGDLSALISELSVAQRPVFLFGPSLIPAQKFDDIFRWAKEHRIPCITEILSQIKPNAGVFDAVFRNETFIDFLKPDLIVRFGRQPVSKGLENYLTHHQEVPHLHFDFFDVWHDATFSTNEHFFGTFNWRELEQIETLYDEFWFEKWQQLETEFHQKVEQVLTDCPLTDGLIARTVSKWNHFDAIHVANSFPIRDFESFFDFHSETKPVFCNRSANGIDGIVATALGNSAEFEHFCTLIGDVAFLHDASSLALHREYKSNHTIILTNNSGGRIFDMLPVAKSAPELMERYFHTSIPLSVKSLCEAFQVSYSKVETAQSLEIELNKDFVGCRVIECISHPEESMRQRQLLQSF